MTATTLFEEILSAFRAEADAERAKWQRAYMRHQFQFLGVAKPLHKALLKPYLPIVRKAETTDWPLIFNLWQCEYREMQYVAMEFLHSRRKTFTPVDVPHFQRLILEKSWWDTVDGLDRMVGDIAARYPQVKNTLLEWSLSDNIWLRRVAIDHQLLRKADTDTALLEQVIVNNLGQKEFFINKAIGWSLRDYSKTNPHWVRDFIARYASQMSKLSIREASKYI